MSSPDERLDLSETHLWSVNLLRARLVGAMLRDVKWNAALLDRAQLERATLEGAHLEGAHMFKAQLRRANLSHANLKKADLDQADLEEAILNKVDLSGASFLGANLAHVDLRTATLETRFHTMGTDDRDRVQFGAARLYDADLRGVVLTYTNMKSAQLQAAHLQGAWLDYTRLEYANLADANLSGAHLMTDLSNVEGLTIVLVQSAHCYQKLPNHIRAALPPEARYKIHDEDGKPNRVSDIDES
jgi:uncharacterized protein YjbI with pentapeptide repeats